MYYNLSGENVDRFLNEVHIKMISKYAVLRSTDEYNAKVLQDFFQELKLNLNQRRSGQPITNNVVSLVGEIVNQRHPKTRKLGLFTQKGGNALEADLSIAIEAVYAKTLNISRTKNNNAQYIVGAKTGAVLEGVVTEKVQQVLKDLNRETKTFLSQDAQKAMGLTTFKPLNVQVQQKVDNQGGFFTISFSPTTYLEKIMVLLNEATFSAKNYSSVGKNQEKLDEISPNLKIGNSNPYRAYSGALSSLGYDAEAISSTFVAAYQALDDYQMIKQHIYHLRFIYELSGAGIVLNDGTLAKEVKYLVYNDPSGSNIFVESVAKIIYEILNDKDNKIQDPFKGITIKKSYFKNR